MLIQIATFYGLTLLACAVAAGALEWLQLTRSKPLAPPLDWTRALAVGWLALPLAVPALLLLALIRRLGSPSPVRT